MALQLRAPKGGEVMRLFRRWDTNGDGTLTFAEIDKVGPPPNCLP